MSNISVKIQNLLDLASNNPSEEEAKAALLKAQELMLKYHIENPETLEDEAVTTVYSILKQQKTQFVLLLSVECARNFRCKTVHYGQKIYFLGFEEDAKAAIECFNFLLNFANVSYHKFFETTELNNITANDWRKGFIVGLHTAFVRPGFELMVQVPQKVMDVYNNLNLEAAQKNEITKPSTTTGSAFVDGFRRGKESMANKEIEAMA